MSVTVTIHFPVSDVAKAIEGLHGNAQFLEEITESTRGAGMLHHRFVSGDGELMVIDEWETAKQFQSFFDGNPKVADVMASIGMTGPPEITVFGSTRPAPSKQAQGPRSGIRRPATEVGGHTGTLVRVPNAGRWDSARILSPTEHAEAWTNRTRTEPKRGWTTS